MDFPFAEGTAETSPEVSQPFRIDESRRVDLRKTWAQVQPLSFQVVAEYYRNATHTRQSPEVAATSEQIQRVASHHVCHLEALYRLDFDSVAKTAAELVQDYETLNLNLSSYLGSYSAFWSAVATTHVLGRASARDRSERVRLEQSLVLHAVDVMASQLLEREVSRRTERSNLGLANQLLDDAVAVNVKVHTSSGGTLGLHGDLDEIDEKAQMIASAGDEMLASVAEIERRATDELESAARAATTTQNGRVALDNALRGVTNLLGLVEVLADRARQLTTRSRDITKIVAFIDGIANQTNLLALNATIEAARAGEAGKGFGVVAGEVKSLSRQTAGATENIRAQVENLLEDVRAITATLDDAGRAAQQTRLDMETIDHSMKNIQGAVSVSEGRSKEISEILGDQSSASKSVVAGITNVATRIARARQTLRAELAELNELESSAVAQVERLATLDLPLKALRLAKSDHARWMKRLGEALAGLKAANVQDFADHRSCRFGKWYHGPGQAEFGSLPEFVAINSVHEQVHGNGREAVRLFNEGDRVSAMEAYSRAREASRQILRLLDSLNQTLSARQTT